MSASICPNCKERRYGSASDDPAHGISAAACPGSVLLLKACALHHDNLTLQYIAQLKWQNLSQRTITAALISLSCTNAFGRYTVNGRHPLRVVVTAVQPGATAERTLRSGPVWETNLSPGDAVDVLFDPLNEKKYVILMDPQA